MSDPLQKQNQAFLNYATGGPLPKYSWLPAPNVPPLPADPAAEHLATVTAAVETEATSIRNSLQRGVGLEEFRQELAGMAETIKLAVAYKQDVTRVADYPRYAALSQILATATPTTSAEDEAI